MKYSVRTGANEMTVQTRRFIDLADIIGLRFECKRCRASLELTLERLEQGTLQMSELSPGLGAAQRRESRGELHSVRSLLQRAGEALRRAVSFGVFAHVGDQRAGNASAVDRVTEERKPGPQERRGLRRE